MAIALKVGMAVRGEDFFKREREIKELWNMIESGSHILVSAPRRGGKTSLMFYIHDNPKQGFQVIYEIIESVSSENEYYKKIFKAVLNRVYGKRERFFNNATTTIKDLFKRIKTVNQDGVELFDESKLNYYEELVNLIKILDLGSDKLIIIVDEFAQTIENIIKHHDELTAIHFLQTNRELRQMLETRDKIQFIYTGSIGLENVVSKLNSVNLINDLNVLQVRPLSVPQAKRFVSELLENLNFSLSDKQIEDILSRIKWLIPFYIQIIIKEINSIRESEGYEEIDEGVIELSFKRILEYRNHFDHWESRLKKAIKQQDYRFAKEVLNSISVSEMIHSNEIFNIAVKHEIEEDYKSILRILAYDGYINNDENVQIYRFNSPILKMWWCKNVAN